MSDKVFAGQSAMNDVLKDIKELHSYVWKAGQTVRDVEADLRECELDDMDPSTDERLLASMESLINKLFTIREITQEADQCIGEMLEAYGWTASYDEDRDAYVIYAPNLDKEE